MQAALPSRDLRSVKVQQELRAHWKQVIKKRPPSERERFLRSQEGIVALGAKMCHDLLREIARDKDFLLKTVPSDSWREAVFEGGESFPPGKNDTALPPGVKPRAVTNWRELARLFERPPGVVRRWMSEHGPDGWPFGPGPWPARTVAEIGRWVVERYGVRMTLSRVPTSYGDPESTHHAPLPLVPSHRYLPPQCADLEDQLDAMTAVEALFYRHPPSCSAVMIQRIEHAKGREGEDRRGRMGRKRAILMRRLRAEDRGEAGLADYNGSLMHGQV